MTESPVPAGPDPAAPITDDDRQVLVSLLQQALAQDVVPFEEADDRFAAVFEAETRGDLDAVVADLPPPPAPQAQPVGHPLPATSVSLIGDTRVGGLIAVDGDLTFVSLIGDVVVDLSSATLPDEVTITAWSLIGDVTVIVADGHRASLGAIRLLGDQRIELVPARPGTATIRVATRTVIGDSRLYSLSQLPEGKLRALWRRLRGTEAS